MDVFTYFGAGSAKEGKDPIDHAGYETAAERKARKAKAKQTAQAALAEKKKAAE